MKKEKANGTAKKPITKRWWFWAVVVFLVIGIIGSIGNSGEESSSDGSSGTQDTAQPTHGENDKIQDVSSEPTSSTALDGQLSLNEFFATIGTDIEKSAIEDVAESFGLYINHKNNGTGTYVYRIAADKGIANVNSPEKGSYVTVSFGGNAPKEITYFDVDRMIGGYWSQDTGYLLADYNYPQIVYLNEENGKTYSRMPVDGADDIINYSFNGTLDENLLETLFISITPSTTKDDLMNFVDEHALNYNSRGVGNEKIISYCYEIGEKYGETGSYITFDTDGDGLITRMTYWYYPANYRNGYGACFYSKSYAEKYSVPQGFVLKTPDGSEEFSSAEELIAQLHK